MNVQNIAVLLRALRQGEPSPRATTTARPVASVAPVLQLASEDGSAPALRSATEHLAGRLVEGDGEPSRVRGEAPEPAPLHARGGREAAGHSRDGAAPAAFTGERLGATIALSPAAALLGQALRAAPGAPGVAVVHTPDALLDAPPLRAGELAHALEAAMARSGLFYESHVAQWAMNGYPLDDLDREPQAGWRAGVGAETNAPAGAAGRAWHDTAAPLVRQQLDVLEFGRVLWQGHVWPGQAATIEFADPRHVADHTTAHGGVQPASFRTRVEVELPSLGRIVAVIGVDDRLVTCRITAASTDAVERLAAGGPALSDAMDARELVLASCAIDHETAA